jgi:SAM-dependent methyltransferase
VPLLAESTDILQNNLAALPSATRLALDCTETDVSCDSNSGWAYATVRTPSGQVVRIHSSASSGEGSVAMVSKVVAGGAPPLLIVIGTGLGYLLDALEHRAPETKVLAIEPVPAISQAMLSRRDWRSWLESGRLTLLVGPEYAGAADAPRLFSREAGAAPVIASPLLEREFAAATAEAKSVVATIVAGARANEEARKVFAGRYLLNTLSNLSTIASEGDVAALFDAFAGVPAIVVGAGPSLDRNVEALRKLQNQALVVAVDTATRPLLAAGIRPHLIVAVDPSDFNAQHLRDLPVTRNMWLVAEGSLDPSVFPQFAAHTFTFKVSNHHPWPWLVEHGADRGTLKAWGSVLTTAFDLARRAGCDPIVFAGADLAYTEGLLYCRETIYEAEWKGRTREELAATFRTGALNERPTCMEPDISGTDTLTAPHFVQFRNWMVAQARQMKNRRVMNATGAGILHGGGILQVDLGALQLDPPSQTGPDLRARIADAYKKSSSHRSTTCVRMQAALDVATPTAAWLDFAGETATSDQVAESLASANRSLLIQQHAIPFLARRRKWFDRTIVTEADAQRLSYHAPYDLGVEQGRAQQAHVLLDYLRRTCRVGPQANVSDVVRSAFAVPDEIRILDFGCGIGRSMQALAEAGLRIDGADFSERMLTFARVNPKLAGSQFFLTNGLNCGNAPPAAYDLVYSQFCFRHIPSRAIRRELLQAMRRTLRPHGVIVVQLRFCPDLRAKKLARPHLPWSADPVIEGANAGAADVWVTPDELHMVYEDFSRCFANVALQTTDLRPTPHDPRPAQLVVSGSAGRATTWSR